MFQFANLIVCFETKKHGFIDSTVECRIEEN